MDPLVSVIIPFYDAISFLEETIEAVFAQTFTNYELLLCDDGSKDGGTQIAEKYAETHNRVRYVQHPGHGNLGQFSTRILGAKYARSSVLALLDADDLWDPYYLEKHFEIWRSVATQGVYLSYGPSLYWFYEDSTGARDFVQPMPPGAPKICEPGELLPIFLSSGYRVTPCPSCTLIRKEVFLELSKFESVAKETLAFEDQILWWYAAARWPIAVHKNVWVLYRQSPRSSVAITYRTQKGKQAELKFLEAIGEDLARECPEHPLLTSGKLGRHMERLARRTTIKEDLRDFLYEHLPKAVYRRIRNVYHGARSLLTHSKKLPIVRHLRCIQLRRLQPLKKGRPYGTAVVRYYWERYLEKNRCDIRGHALEIGTTGTIERFGGNALTQADALDMIAHSSEINVVADLSRADHVASDTYDCFVNQFSTQFICNIEAALYHSIRILKPGGVLLINFPCVDYYFPEGLDMDTGVTIYMHWWFTPIHVENLLRQIGLTDKDYKVDILGNLFARVACQMNMPAEELTRHELEFTDLGHPLLICVRAVKPLDWQTRKPEYREPYVIKGTPVHWNPETCHYPTR